MLDIKLNDVIFHLLHALNIGESPMQTLKTGDTAPAFTLKNQKNEDVSLSDYAGRWLVLYFYPKALTPGCTTQACMLRDAQVELNALNAAVVGVSGDDPALLQKFTEQENLNFTLLGDPSQKMLEAYGAWQEKSMYGRKYMGVTRMTIIISPEGKVSHIMPKVNPKTHLDDVLSWLKTHTKKAA